MTDPIRLNPNQKVNQSQNIQAAQKPAEVNGSSFADLLNEADQKVKFSSHAQKRLEVRSIEMDEGKIDRLSTAVDKANAHGAKESLILMDDLAFIVNVRERTVVTTVDMNRRKEGVFTQIDTVVFADPAKNDLGKA
jgi:flagellar operon protein